VQQKELAAEKEKLNILEEQTDAVRTSRAWSWKRRAADSKFCKRIAQGIHTAVESQVTKLEEKLSILGRQKELLSIRSPIDGIVATSYLQNRIGDFLDKGDMFCEIVSEGTVIVEMPIPEKEIGDIRIGHPITLKVRGYPKRWYEARVKSIAPVAAPTSAGRTVIVRGELENPDGSLKAGMTGVGRFSAGADRFLRLPPAGPIDGSVRNSGNIFPETRSRHAPWGLPIPKQGKTGFKPQNKKIKKSRFLLTWTVPDC